MTQQLTTFLNQFKLNIKQNSSVWLVGWSPSTQFIRRRKTKIIYKSDANHIDSGLVGRISHEYTEQFEQQTWTLRSFPEGTRNCYNFNLTANQKYLIRGTFFYGNYDGLNRFSSFDLHIGPNKWSSVKLKGVGVDSIYEIIHVLPQDRLQVCLVKTGEMTPFINSLEIRPLKNGTYDTQSGSLITVSRFYFPPTKQVIRYDNDIHDRLWFPYLDKQMVSISTNLLVNSTNSFYDVPQRVVKTAAVPANSSQPLTLNLTLDETTAESYIYMHFAEIQNLEANETREFNVTYNGGQEWFSYFRPPNFKITTASSREAMSSPDGNFNFTLAMTGNSTLPPIINAVEIYEVLDLRQLETDEDEERSYELMKKVSWQGDPCAPQFLLWEGLKCSYPNADSPMITSLNFKESNLTGSITLEFVKLTQLIELDLSKNDLSGEIPSFFADMKSLKLIIVKSKDLKITYPEVLKITNNFERVLGKGGFGTVYYGNVDDTQVAVKMISHLSAQGYKEFKSEVDLLLRVHHRHLVGLVGYCDDGDNLALIYEYMANGDLRVNISVKSKDLKITYPEVLKITNNFERVLGKGGFGTVYYGNVDDTQVAVKMISHLSAQGYKEFKSEVDLLLRVHHRHLVGLVGYCDDGDNLALIYEYMANGDLRVNISGLEYLHNGCQPPMVHRDVKTTNILLNERYGAKLADFGISKSFPIDGEYHVSTAVAGPPGYLDPDFGVVLLEIITNQPVIDKTREGPHINEWAVLMLTKGDIRSIIDPKLMGDYDTNGAWKTLELALACVNPSPYRRPTMAHVVMELNQCVALENARKQGCEEVYSRGSVNICLASASEFVPGPK
ncbi:hypothetical protein F2Q69_00011536 [Brassica cretica]|uniref:Protein kinase domain-containing protein n=1 Tax=Brassica cretica TaxID=69181 RepID=A0A8S9QN53_BRACR|nr:hypothetical protein F2Q69_00011536 [Brassica cretica]